MTAGKEEKTNVLDLHPRLAEGGSLHRMPIGGALVGRHGPGTGITGKHIRHLNPRAVALLERCDGSAPLRTIMEEFAAPGHGLGMSPEAVGDFLSERLEEGVVELYDAAAPLELTVTGSTDYFTPLHFTIETTDRCNMRCLHCYRNSGPENDQALDTDVLLGLIDMMAEEGIISVELTGGEPTLHAGFDRILRRCLDSFGMVALITNGSTLSEQMLSPAREAPNFIAQIDLDGPRAEVHNTIRQSPTSFGRALRSARLLGEFGIRFRAAMNVCKINLPYVAETAALAHDLGATWFTFSPIMDIGRGRGMQLLDRGDQTRLKELLDTIPADYREDFVRVERELRASLFEKPGHCGGGYRSVVLGPDGSLRPCTMMDPGLTFGNLLRQDYHEIFSANTGEYYFNLQMPDESLCGDCRFLYFCKGCFVRPLRAMEINRENDLGVHCRWDEETGFTDFIHSC